MSESHIHKRKRNLQDSPVDISKMRILTTSLEALREELSGIDETEEEMEEVIKHVNELDCILKEAKRVVRSKCSCLSCWQKVTFSNATLLELTNLQVKDGFLVFDNATVRRLSAEPKPDLVEKELQDLHARLRKIYNRVNMNVRPCRAIVPDPLLMCYLDSLRLAPGWSSTPFSCRWEK